MTTDEKSKGRNLLKLALLLIGIAVVAFVILFAYSYLTRAPQGGIFVSSCGINETQGFVEIYALHDLLDVKVTNDNKAAAERCGNVICEYSSIKRGSTEVCNVPHMYCYYTISAANEKNVSIIGPPCSEIGLLE